VAAIEFALMLPIFLIVLLMIVELSRMILIQQKLEKTVASMGDFLTQGEFACSVDMNAFRDVARNDIMDPFDFSEGSITFSSVVNYNTAIPPCGVGVPCIAWQDGVKSNIGSPGAVPQNLNGLEIDRGQNYIVTELNYRYEPLLLFNLQAIADYAPAAVRARDIYIMSVHKPRLGSLTRLDPVGKCGN
jgi:hypothetical protein